MKISKALSRGEETFALHCKVHGLAPEREFQFKPPRKWRWDFCWRSLKLAIEIDGGTSWGRSRHSRGEGYENDCRKLNQAVLDGWRVLRFTTSMVESGEAIQQVLIAIGSTEPV